MLWASDDADIEPFPWRARVVDAPVGVGTPWQALRRRPRGP
ncbi:MAG TPA: hypothetical protein PKW35_22705 [Nannocystaceae bacterium]|nr:hypothetical protein [Nannocystaceae bacterium]